MIPIIGETLSTRDGLPLDDDALRVIYALADETASAFALSPADAGTARALGMLG